MDSSLYSPDASLVPRYVAFLSQRDVSYSVPINHVPQPGVALTAACFANLKYEEAPATRCISNLLAAGFRRVEADIYWDSSRSLWSLCPIELGTPNEVLTTSTSLLPTATEPPPASLSARQDDELTSQSAVTTLISVSVAEASKTLTLSADTTTTALEGTGTSTAGGADGSAIRIGAYDCTPSMNFDLLLSILSARLTDTATDLNASTVILSLNVHAAAAASAPSDSARQPPTELLPSPQNLLSSAVLRNLSSRVYTPSDLSTQKGGLNSSQSWFTVNPAEEPASAYFQVVSSNGGSSTPDGWPSERYIEMSIAKRLLMEFGGIDPQMAEYNFSADSSLIFPRGYLTEPTTTTFRSNGSIVSGCLFDPTVTTVAGQNNSWALRQLRDSAQGDAIQRLAIAKSLTDCGISPFLNESLANATADEAYAPYQAFVESTIWSWGPDQPVNASESEELNDYRCAALNATSDLACDDDSAFAVPRTPLENAHLLSVWREYRRTRDEDADPLLWLDFNQLDVSACWVTGQNTTCPYMLPADLDSRRILVPVIGAFIIFVLAALTVCIKCVGNRQTARRRKRRGNDGWDYEGVPS
ncbi:related to Lectin C-type domain protein [Ramularia collo-cygni]|uniref:Maintenance of telomere capping protein 6 n=1 Tax=Ramularia collo-cygni TaxID=112498 RepID=A0A2D3VGY9_9PEZI|nr:related to Lectin C-type domain protein [Ramularia collo-cygni]CZT19983.1 related to Lectin C-type domain protein [Ramularia collo-cygni]